MNTVVIPVRAKVAGVVFTLFSGCKVFVSYGFRRSFLGLVPSLLLEYGFLKVIRLLISFTFLRTYFSCLITSST